MPRRKAQGINLQKRTVVVKSQNSAHNKKAVNYEKTKESNDYIKQTAVKAPNRVPELTTITAIEKNDDVPSDIYQHKKFKKIAEISASNAKTEKTEIKIKNGFDLKRTESHNLDLVPKVEERVVSNCNSYDLSVKSEVKTSEPSSVMESDVWQQQQCQMVSPGSSPVRAKSPLMKKEDVHLGANPGRYVCSYCQLACAKPSVLQKHIRAHTNERPYPCSPCGFAFKTKSNLYKHCRSQAHRFKTGEGQAGSEKCDSGDELSEDSSPGDYAADPVADSVPLQVQKNSDGEGENQHKIYKPKFHKATLYQDEVESSSIKSRIQEGIYKKQEADDKPRFKTSDQPKSPSLFGMRNLPPSPEFLQQHISKIISDNQAIVETMEPQWTKKFLQRQNSREKELASPLSNVSSPGLEHFHKYSSDLKKKDETKSKLALALLKIDKNDRFTASYPKPEVNSDNHTYQPLNLTKKDSDDKAKYQSLGGSCIKEILIKSREVDALGQHSPRSMAEILSSFQDVPEGKGRYGYYGPKSPEKEVEAPYLSPGPLLGSTPLVEVKTESGPPPKKRRIHSTTYPPESDLLYRRLSTSSLPSTLPSSNGLITSPNRPSSSPSTTLKSLEELSKHPMKPSSLNMFGGEVKILDCGETKTMRIESIPNAKPAIEASEDNPKFLVTIAKTGLHSGGGTLVQVPATTTATTATSPHPTNSFQMASILNYPDTAKLLMPLVPNISLPNLSIPPQEDHPPYGQEKSNGGILTIVHGGKQIPYVPGIPGPQTVLPPEKGNSDSGRKSKEPTTKSMSSLISMRKPSSSNQPKNVPNDIPKIEISCPKSESRDSRKDEISTESGLKFLRPTSLPLRPGSFTPKRLHQGITPTVLSLVSPETPRPKKSYGQLFLNGHAYTYLGLKCSTRSYYCTISRPQPMYVVQSAQHPKLSMYSNWKVYSEAEPSLFGLTPAKAMSHYDSRHRTSAYTIADKNKSSTGLVTHSSWVKSPEKQSAKEDGKTDASESASWPGEAAPKRVKIFAGGYASNEDYTYVRGRGRGRYVCEECGIRCKKPSMLKKHIRTHTDVRPYTCKHCMFSFKTKGNLTKHMKSKAHYKKCMELNISPIPTTVEAENIDEELLLQQQALKQDGNDESENEEDDEDEDSDGGDEEETTTEDPESLEREAACSLLSLSETTTRSSQYKSLYIAAGLIPKNLNAVRPSTYPYMTVKLTSGTAEDQPEKESVRIDDSSQSYPLPESKPDKVYDNERPIDLSQKESRSEFNFLSKDSEFLTKSKPDAKSVVTTAIPVPAYLLASITNAGMQCDKIASDLAGSHMLQAYLTAKALHDVKIKQQQNHKSVRSFSENSESDSDSHRQFDKVSQLHQNFCRIYEKTVENDSVNLKRFRNEKNGLAESGEGRIRRFEPIENGQKVLGDLNMNKVAAEKVEDVMMKAGEGNQKTDQEEKSEKSDNVSVTVETSSGKMILVSIPTEGDRLSSPPTGFLSKSSGDNKLKAEFFPPSSGPSPSYVSVTEDGRSICVMCNKIFTKASHLKLHVNIHYFERPFRCEACAVSFRTKGHLLKHERSGSHHNKVSMNTTFGTATTSNPRPFKCEDCKIAFRIHGHLAKHLRSKMHIMKLECIGKLPFGTYAEMERSGVNLNEIDTTDCENSLESLQVLAQKLYEKDPSKLGQIENSTTKINHSTNEDDVGNCERDAGVVNEGAGDSSSSDGFQFSMESPEKTADESNELVCNSRVVSSGSIKKEVLSFPDLGGINNNNNNNNRNRGKSEKLHGCNICDEKFDNLTSLQVHLFAEHNKDMKMDSMNVKLNGKSDDNIEKTIKSSEESLIDSEKGK